MTIKHHIQNSKNSCSHNCHGVSVKCGNVECRKQKVKCGMKSAEWCVECGKLVIKAFYIAYFFAPAGSINFFLKL